MNGASLPLLWANCVERLKDRVNNRSFWEAIERTRAITIENGKLIVGLDSANFNRATYIQHTTHANVVHQVIQEIFNQPLQLRLIEGTSLDDWELTKVRDARIAAMRQAEANAPAVPQSAQVDTWDTFYEYVARLYAQAPLRTLPQGKARYANEALYTLVETMETLYTDDADEQTERSLARILDRIANMSEIPATVLAFELERLRAWHKSNQDMQDMAESAN